VDQRTKVGVIGSGSIGQSIIQDLRQRPDVELVFVLARDLDKLASLGLPTTVCTDKADEALSRDVDLVIEAALPELVAELAPRFLEKADFCAFSCTALADPPVEAAIRATIRSSGRRFFVPHGAVLGLDGLCDGGDLLEQVTVVTTKSGKSLGLDPECSGTVFEGSARQACQRFPRNVNVHAAVALAGIGLDRTVSRIVAVPHQETNEHRIEVAGQDLSWVIEVSSRSLGGVTGSYTPRSAIGSIERILGGQGIRIV
jgi:aspartate dehydrogenase